MFLTVAIPIYNAELYLEECIESVLSQSMKDYEILLVNDGSTDNTLSICDAYTKQYPQVIRVLHTKHQGSMLTRRYCLEKAKGDFVHIIDADDKLVDVDAYRNLYLVHMELEGDFYFFNYKSDALRKGNNNKDIVVHQFQDKQIFEGKAKEKLEYLFLNSDIFNTLWNKIFKRDLIDIGEDYSCFDDMVIGEDLVQLLPIFTKAKKIIYIDKMLYFYRLTENSLTRKFDSKTYESIKRTNFILNKYWSIWGLPFNKKVISLFGKKRLTGCLASVNKVRYCSKDEKKVGLLYLQEIANDSYFLDAYRYLFNLPAEKVIIAILLKMKLYNIIWFSIRLQNLYK